MFKSKFALSPSRHSQHENDNHINELITYKLNHKSTPMTAKMAKSKLLSFIQMQMKGGIAKY